MTFEDLYEDLLVLTSGVGVRPDVPAESETFFAKVVETFQGSEDECLSYIKEQLPFWFRSINQQPFWIQDAEWQFSSGQPMVFIGQTDVPQSFGLFHDDATFYTFYNPKNDEIKTVIQLF